MCIMARCADSGSVGVWQHTRSLLVNEEVDGVLGSCCNPITMGRRDQGRNWEQEGVETVKRGEKVTDEQEKNRRSGGTSLYQEVKELYQVPSDLRFRRDNAQPLIPMMENSPYHKHVVTRKLSFTQHIS